jgi:hypothetical protein
LEREARAERRQRFGYIDSTRGAMKDKAKLVVEEVESHQVLLDAESARDLEAIREGYQQSLTEEGIPAEEFFKEFEARHGL